jgi:NADH dehydrogenase
VWSAGVVASRLATALATEAGAGLDRVGRVGVGADLTIPGGARLIFASETSRARGETRHEPAPREAVQ